jgi:hypothetical protein
VRFAAVSSAERSAPRSAAGTTIDRTSWLALATIVAGVNALATTLLDSFARGWVYTLLDLGGVNPALWFALFAIARIAAEPNSAVDPAPAMTLLDWAVFASVLAAAFMPVPLVGAAGVLAAALWLLLRGRAGSRARRVGVVTLALTSTLIWGRAVLVLVGEPLLSLDAAFVAWLAGTHSQGNLVYFAGEAQPFVIGFACSSMHNMTLAVLFWASLTQLLQIPIDRRAVSLCLAAMGVNLLVNGLRLAMIAHNQHAYDYWHSGPGGSLFAWAGLAAVAVVVGIGCVKLADRRA